MAIYGTYCTFKPPNQQSKHLKQAKNLKHSQPNQVCQCNQYVCLPFTYCIYIYIACAVTAAFSYNHMQLQIYFKFPNIYLKILNKLCSNLSLFRSNLSLFPGTLLHKSVCPPKLKLLLFKHPLSPKWMSCAIGREVTARA